MEDGEKRIALCSLYLLFGIAMIAMSFNLVQEEVIIIITAINMIIIKITNISTYKFYIAGDQQCQVSGKDAGYPQGPGGGRRVLNVSHPKVYFFLLQYFNCQFYQNTQFIVRIVLLYYSGIKEQLKSKN